MKTGDAELINTLLTSVIYFSISMQSRKPSYFAQKELRSTDPSFECVTLCRDGRRGKNKNLVQGKQNNVTTLGV